MYEDEPGGVGTKTQTHDHPYPRVFSESKLNYRPVPTAPPERSTARAAAIAVILALLVGSLAGAIAGFGGGILASRSDLIPGNHLPSAANIDAVAAVEPVAAAAAVALPSVVNIDVSSPQSEGAEEELSDELPSSPIVGNGSGVAFQRIEGGGTYVLTNNHVIEGADAIIIKGMDRERHSAKVVGTDTDTDIAVLRVEADLPVIAVGDSDAVQVGEMVIAIGSPFGLSHSVTSGVVSAMGRSLPDPLGTDEDAYPLIDVIQTDAAINPGNSGGALVDRTGRLVGINTAIYSEGGVSGGIGFAIPAKAAVRVGKELIAKGHVAHPFLGIVGQSVDPLIAREQQLPAAEGALVIDIQKGTSAAVAGVKPGDLIVEVDGAKIHTMDDLLLEVRRRRIGDKVDVLVYRGDAKTRLSMIVGAKPGDGDPKAQ